MTRHLLIMAWHDPAGRERADEAVRRSGGKMRRVTGATDHVVLAREVPTVTSLRPGLTVLGEVRRNAATGESGEPLERLRELIATAWGGYVALASDGGDHFVMIDPSGARPAHMAQDRSLTLVTDRLDPDLLRAAGFEVTVDPAALAGCLLDPGTMVAAPLLLGVRTLAPGIAYALAPEGDDHVLWSPAAIEPDAMADGAGLRRAVELAVGTMARGGRTLVELSGGLDSSIVAGTLSTLDTAATGVAVELIGGDVDEVRYARASAERCGMPLHVGRTSAYPDYRTFMEAPQVAHPYLYGTDDAFARIVVDAADGADRIVTGQGGDAVFFQPATPLTTVDRFRALGLRSGWPALLDDARRSRASIWHHLLPVVADRLRPIGTPQDELAAGLLTPEAREHRTRFLHPWVADARHLPPGRQLQILMLANSLVFHSARAIDLGRPLLHPLLSQPVIESALAIPTWRLASGPLDRGLARSVFADRLHPLVAGRRSKGEAAAFYSRAVVANLPYLRERLLGGVLVGMGIVDRSAMERALTPEYLFHSLDYRALVLHAACEAWAGAWAG